MSLWARVQYLSQPSKQLIYNRYQEKLIPIEVRQHIPIWIENNFLSEAANTWIPGNPEHEANITRLCTEFIDEIERVVAHGNDHDFLQIKLRSASTHLRTGFNPIELFTRIKDCLNEELRLLDMETTIDSQIKSESGVPNSESKDMAQRVCLLVNHRFKYGSMMQDLQSTQAELRLQAKQIESTNDLLVQLSQAGYNKNGVNYENSIRLKLDRMNRELQAKVAKWQECETGFLEFAEGLVEEIDGLVQKITEEFLKSYKWSDRNEESSVNMDDFQKWYGEIIESISEVANLLKQSMRDSVALALQFGLEQSLQQRVQFLLDKLDNLYFCLMNESMIVEEQPPPVIKKETKFNTSVRFLCGEKFIPQHCQPVVTALVINEAQANCLFKHNDPSKVITAGCGRIINNVASKFSDGTSYRLIHQFRNVAISNVRRADKKNDSRAMSEKFCLIFFTKLQIGEKSYMVWSCSVPFVFIVHVSQKLEGWATIFWDSSFREPNREPFVVPESVPWGKMAKALNRCFKKMTSTEWNLTDTNIRYLGEKFFQTPDFTDAFCISRKKFCEKENLNTIGLWEWFYACIELTNRHLRPFWDKGYIIGFISRARAEDLLIRQGTPGTFLLRFSDNTLGGISITYVESLNEGQVASLLPFTDSDLKMRSLEDRLRDIGIYQTVYHQGKDNEDCLTDKAKAFAGRSDRLSNRRDSNRSVKLNYVPANIIMVINPNGTTLPTCPPPMECAQPNSPDTDAAGIEDDILEIILQLEESQMQAQSYNNYGDFDMEDCSRETTNF